MVVSQPLLQVRGGYWYTGSMCTTITNTTTSVLSLPEKGEATLTVNLDEFTYDPAIVGADGVEVGGDEFFEVLDEVDSLPVPSSITLVFRRGEWVVSKTLY